MFRVRKRQFSQCLRPLFRVFRFRARSKQGFFDGGRLAEFMTVDIFQSAALPLLLRLEAEGYELQAEAGVRIVSDFPLADALDNARWA